MSTIHCPKCKHSSFFKWGFHKNIQCLGGKSLQRYRCRRCQTLFCQNTTLFHFRLKKPDPALNSKIFQAFIHGLSNREIGRFLHISEHCVRGRLDRMSKQAFVFHNKVLQDISAIEAIAYDGLENFAGSQYDPNNIQQAIGSESLFIYDFNFAPLNRKGRMSSWQKKRLLEIEAKHGRYNPSAIRVQSAKIFKRLKALSAGKLELLSDEHFQYPRALKEAGVKPESHLRISSKACRNFQNILFSVNHADLLARQRLAVFERETISFAKTAGRMCQKYALFLLHKNYMCAQFTKRHVKRPRAHEQSPAQQIGVADRILKFGEMFNGFPGNQEKEELNEDWQFFYDGKVPNDCLRSLRFKSRAA